MKTDLGQWWNPFSWFQQLAITTIPYAPPPEAAETIAAIAPWTVSSVIPPSKAAATTIAQIAAEVTPQKYVIDWKRVAPYAIFIAGGLTITAVLLLRRKK